MDNKKWGWEIERDHEFTESREVIFEESSQLHASLNFITVDLFF